MLNWHEFAKATPDLAAAGVRLFDENEVAFLATASAEGRPRLHPFVPKIVNGRLVAFIMHSSPKIRDLRRSGQYAIHALPGSEDEEFCFSGTATECDDESDFRSAATTAMGFATGVDDEHILFEFRIDKAIWTRWLDFGTPEHRPLRRRWPASTQGA